MKKKRTRPDKHTERLQLTDKEVQTADEILIRLKAHPDYSCVRPLNRKTAIRFALGRCLAGMDE
jgi:hypothetical protein